MGKVAFLGRPQCDYQGCPHCARAFFKWYKGRMNQMHVPRKNKGETVPFSDAAATSVKPPKENEDGE